MSEAAAASKRIDFFVSRTGADAAWAQWIAWQLEANGYSVVIQDWDFGPGANFVGKMQQAATNAERTIAVLSPRYFQSRFTEEEWAAALYRDTLLPIRIEDFTPPGLFGPRNCLDLFDLNSNTAAQRLLDWIGRAAKPRGKPDKEPNFPGRIPLMFGLPSRNPYFTGREALLENLRKQLTGGKPTAVHGLGGTGKSQLAIEYAWRWASDYSQVIWLRAETPQTLGADFDVLAGDLDKPTEQTAVIKAVVKRLEQNPGWLLIFDNAPNPKAVEHAVPLAGGQVIFTSRHTAWGKYAVPLRVDVWKIEEAVRFLLKRAGARGDEHPATQLAEELGCLPLALEHAAAYCEQSGLTLADYLRLFRQRRLELFTPETVGDMVTVTTTWNLSIDQCPEAADLFTLCAFFAPDRIPVEVVRVEAELQDDLKLNRALAALLRYSLVEVDGSGQERVLSVHRLLHEVTRERLTEDEKRRWITVALKIVNQAFPEDSDDVRQWPACAQLAPHAVAVLHHAEPLGIERKVTSRLLDRLAIYSYSRADFPTAEPLLQRALAIRENALGTDHLYTASSLNNLALLYDHQGRREEAEPLYLRALAIHEKARGPDHPDSSTTLNNLASLYCNQGRYEEAEPLFQCALTIREKELGADDPLIATSLDNLSVLYNSQGSYEKAEPLCRRAIAIMEKALGPDHPSTATCLANLASLYYCQGRYEEALPLLQRALTIREKALGPYHPDTANTLHSLASLHFKQGRQEQSESLYQRALAIFEKVLGPGHPSTANTRANYAKLLRRTGRDAEAAKLEARAKAPP